jgi:hypothetical protein
MPVRNEAPFKLEASPHPFPLIDPAGNISHFEWGSCVANRQCYAIQLGKMTS